MHNALNEIPILLYCLRTGLIIGICYDLLGFFRLSGRKLLNALIDICFGLFATAAAGLTLLYCDSGIIRLYEFFGMFAGAFLFHEYPGKLLRTIIASIRIRAAGILHAKKKGGKD